MREAGDATFWILLRGFHQAENSHFGWPICEENKGCLSDDKNTQGVISHFHLNSVVRSDHENKLN